MTKETKYGIISDIHEDPIIIVPAIEVLKSQGAKKLLINGDIGQRQRTIQDSQNYIACILDTIGKSGLEAFVQPGSHETVSSFHPVIEHFAKVYPNILNVLENIKVEQEDHDLVFLPGSDFLCGGEYAIRKGPETGMYEDNGMYHFISNMDDLKKQVTNPEKTIIVSHVPRKFDNLENGVDMAHFHQQRVYHNDFKNDPNKLTYTELSVMPGSIPREQIEAQGTKTFGLEDSEEYILKEIAKIMEKEDVNKWAVSVERNDNRGNQDLANLYDELGIKKAVSGHFHESVHRACDRNGDYVEQGKSTDELFWNASYADQGKTGILTVNDSKVSYQNLDLRDYIK